MIHQPYGGMQGVVSDIDIQAKRLLKTKAQMNQMLAELCHQPVEKSLTIPKEITICPPKKPKNTVLSMKSYPNRIFLFPYFSSTVSSFLMR